MKQRGVSIARLRVLGEPTEPLGEEIDTTGRGPPLPDVADTDVPG